MVVFGGTFLMLVFSVVLERQSGHFTTVWIMLTTYRLLSRQKQPLLIPLVVIITVAITITIMVIIMIFVVTILSAIRLVVEDVNLIV